MLGGPEDFRNPSLVIKELVKGKKKRKRKIAILGKKQKKKMSRTVGIVHTK